MAIGVVIGALPVMAVLAFRSTQTDIHFQALDDAELKIAFQQDWAWNHLTTRERKRIYETRTPYDEVVASVRKELIAKGWTEHRIASSSPIYLLREKPGGYHVSVQKHWKGVVHITVSDPRLPSTWPRKIVSVLQGFDGRYQSARSVRYDF